MRAIMPRVDRRWIDQILIADGMSTDGTAEYARAQGYDVVVQQRPGILKGYLAALPHARGDVIITFSPDGNSVPELLPALISKMKDGHDLVIVSRYLRHARSHDDDAFTAFGNWLFTTLINAFNGGRFTDTLVIFRAFRKQLLYDLNLLDEDNYTLLETILFTQASWEPLMSIRAARWGANYAEIPGVEPRRIGGQRKLQPIRWGLGITGHLLIESFRRQRIRRPKQLRRG